MGVMSGPPPGVGWDLQPVECAVCGGGSWEKRRLLELETRVQQEARFPRGCASFFQDIALGLW